MEEGELVELPNPTNCSVHCRCSSTTTMISRWTRWSTSRESATTVAEWLTGTTADVWSPYWTSFITMILWHRTTTGNYLRLWPISTWSWGMIMSDSKPQKVLELQLLINPSVRILVGGHFPYHWLVQVNLSCLLLMLSPGQPINLNGYKLIMHNTVFSSSFSFKNFPFRLFIFESYHHLSRGVYHSFRNSIFLLYVCTR